MGLLHARAGCLTAKNGDFRPGQVHRRVETPAVLKAQAAHALPDTAAYVRAAEALLAEAAAAAPGASGRSGLVFLASDDEAAVRRVCSGRRAFHGTVPSMAATTNTGPIFSV